MKGSLRIGVMALMALSIFSGVALADPPNGGDAGNSFDNARSIEVVRGTWNIYPNGWIEYSGDKDFYKPDTLVNDDLLYDLDQQAIADGAVLTAYNGRTPLPTKNTGWFTVTSADGSSYISVEAVPSSLTPQYQFALNIL